MKSIMIKPVWICSLFFLISVSGGYAGELKKILILPFSIHSEKDMSYLRNGITDMLRTRLTIEGKAAPMHPDEAPAPLNIPAGSISETLAAALGSQARADYVVFGSLTVFGESLSTDAKLLDPSSKKSLVVFNRSGTQTGDVIRHINLFAQRIKANVFDKTLPPVAGAGGRKLEPEKDPDELKRSGPEKQSADDVSSAVPANGPTAPLSENASVITDGVWRGEPVKGKIVGVAAADTNGDGRTEIAVIDGSRLVIYRFESGSLNEIETIKQPARHSIIGLDAGDINGNGRSEIYITKVSESNGRVLSSVIEWNGKSYEAICDKLPWYFRIIRTGNGGDMLAGQKKAMNKPFLEGVHRLEWKNGEPVSAEQLNLPGRINIFDFTIGDVLNSGKNYTVAYLSDDRLSILDPAGETMWRSEESYGGNNVYIEFPAEASAASGGEPEMDRIYVQQRILLQDLDGDGAVELLACRNDDTINRALSRLRIFDHGRLECISWDDQNRPSIEWKTRDFEGYISDFDAADIDQDGRTEIVFSLVGKKKSLFGSKMSSIGIFKTGTLKIGE